MLSLLVVVVVAAVMRAGLRAVAVVDREEAPEEGVPEDEEGAWCQVSNYAQSPY